MSPPTKLQTLLVGVGVGVFVGVTDCVGVGVGVVGTSQSNNTLKSNTSHGDVVVVVVLHIPVVNITFQRSGQADVDGDGPPSKQVPPIVSLKHHC